MINLGRCLVYLLDQHKEVYVAGIGTFQVISNPAYLDPETRSFYSTSFHYNFTVESGQHPSDIIVDYISAQREIDRDAAQAVYRQTLSTLFAALEEKRHFYLEGLGTLHQTAEGLVFQAMELKEGIHPVPELPTINDKVVIEKEEPVEDVALPLISNEDLNPEEYVESKRGTGIGYWWIAIVVILSLGALVALKPGQVYFFLNSYGLEVPLLAQYADEEPVEGPETQLDLAPVVALDSLITDSLDKDSLQIATPLIDSISAVSYEIIVGSFTTMEQAEAFVREMNEKGITVRSMDSRMPGNRKKVSYASYPTEAEAYRALREVQKNIEPGAWVARVEPR